MCLMKWGEEGGGDEVIDPEQKKTNNNLELNEFRRRQKNEPTHMQKI